MGEIQYIVLQDGYLLQKSSKDDEILREVLPLSIFQNGMVTDYHHFLYVIKKFLKSHSISENMKTVLLVESSQIRHINYRLPKVEEKDFEEFLRMELEDSYELTLEDYEMFYESNLCKEEIHVFVELIPKSITLPLRKIFENIGAVLVDILPKSKMYPAQGRYISVELTHIHYLEYEENYLVRSEYFSSENLLSFYQQQSIESSNIISLATGKFDVMQAEVDEDFLLKFNDCFRFPFSGVMRQLGEEEFILTGPLCEISLAQDLLQNGHGKMKFEEELFPQFIYQKKTRYVFPWKKVVLPLVIVVFIIANVQYYLHLQDKLSYWRAQEKTQQELLEKNQQNEQDVSSDFHQEKNLQFLDMLKKIQEKESERILFTDYSYQGDHFLVRGILRKQEDIDLLKDFPIEKKSITKDQGVYKFELQITNS